MTLSSSFSFDDLISALNEKNMKNKNHYKNVVLLSQRIQLQIELIKTYRRYSHRSRRLNKIAIDHQHTKDPQEEILSPTETFISYYDDRNQHDTKEVFYYCQEELLIDDYSRRSSDATAVEEIIDKSLPERRSQLYAFKHYDSAVEIAPPKTQTCATPNKSKLPTSISYQQTISNYLKPLPEPRTFCLSSIKHVKKKYLGIRGFFTRSYHLDNIVVSKTLVSPHLYASRDKLTGEKRAVLKLIVTYKYENDNAQINKNEFFIAVPTTDILNQLYY
ncbi:uncharacterized protein B0P05DRAFT_545265, partial [Gilbertella persicaria]|uniref:uncharacterized protein n=1 Tax=Gilbertella persicaria TaxID=101096 RepID=UPI0022206085